MATSPKIHIQALDVTIHDRKAFDCGVGALNNYLEKQARKESAANVSKCFVASSEPGSSEVLGYYTLSTASIVRESLPLKLAKKLPRYREIPATLLGRLAVAESAQGKGLGTHLLISAMRRSLRASNQVASYALVTDPKDEAAKRFYQKFGFRVLDEQRLFITVKEVQAWLNAL